MRVTVAAQSSQRCTPADVSLPHAAQCGGESKESVASRARRNARAIHIFQPKPQQYAAERERHHGYEADLQFLADPWQMRGIAFRELGKTHLNEDETGVKSNARPKRTGVQSGGT